MEVAQKRQCRRACVTQPRLQCSHTRPGLPGGSPFSRRPVVNTRPTKAAKRTISITGDVVDIVVDIVDIVVDIEAGSPGSARWRGLARFSRGWYVCCWIRQAWTGAYVGGMEAIDVDVEYFRHGRQGL